MFETYTRTSSSDSYDVRKESTPLFESFYYQPIVETSYLIIRKVKKIGEIYFHVYMSSLEDIKQNKFINYSDEGYFLKVKHSNILKSFDLSLNSKRKTFNTLKIKDKNNNIIAYLDFNKKYDSWSLCSNYAKFSKLNKETFYEWMSVINTKNYVDHTYKHSDEKSLPGIKVILPSLDESNDTNKWTPWNSTKNYGLVEASRKRQNVLEYNFKTPVKNSRGIYVMNFNPLPGGVASIKNVHIFDNKNQSKFKLLRSDASNFMVEFVEPLSVIQAVGLAISNICIRNINSLTLN